jgi:hypothetical protein
MCSLASTCTSARASLPHQGIVCMTMQTRVSNIFLHINLHDGHVVERRCGLERKPRSPHKPRRSLKKSQAKMADSRSFAMKATTDRDYAGSCLLFNPCACIGFSVYRRATTFILPGRVSGHDNTLARGNHVVYPFVLINGLFLSLCLVRVYEYGNPWLSPCYPKIPSGGPKVGVFPYKSRTFLSHNVCVCVCVCVLHTWELDIGSSKL